ncbi:MAG: HPr family phosphocarrier protein [Phycisphaerales bacterium]
MKVTILNRLGLHARPAMAFVDVAVGHKCRVTVKRGDQEVDGKSIMQVMMLAATKGTELEIETEGDDAHEAVDRLRALVEGKFGED